MSPMTTVMPPADPRSEGAFGLPIPDPAALADAPSALEAVGEALGLVLERLQPDDPNRLWARCVDQLRASSDTDALERGIRGVLAQTPGIDRLGELFDGRAGLIHKQIRDWVRGDRVLDLGCGDGLVAQALSQDHEVHLADVMDYREPSVQHLPWTRIKDKHPLDQFGDGEFDTVLLLTVLHHSDSPELLLEEACRVSRDRLVVIESVVGVTDPRVVYHGSDGAEREQVERLSKRFVELDLHSQYAYASFVDFFYNRCLHDSVPVPLSFNTPDSWCRLFERAGTAELRREQLGVDQPSVPEFHTLHVFHHAHL